MERGDRTVPAFPHGHKEGRRRTTDSLLIWEERRNEIRITAASDEGVAVLFIVPQK